MGSADPVDPEKCRLIREMQKGSKEGQSFRPPPGFWITGSGGSVAGYFYCQRGTGACTYSHDYVEGWVCGSRTGPAANGVRQGLLCFPSLPQPSSYLDRFAGELQSLAGGALDALTSECAQGVASLGALTILAMGAAYYGAPLIAAGGFVGTSAGAAATSGAAIGAAAFGPIHSETITQMGGFAVGGVRQTAGCIQ
jgi:hypothetical protein